MRTADLFGILIYIISFATLMFFFAPLTAYAEEPLDPVVIEIKSDKEVSMYHFSAEVNIQFNDTSRYNDSCKLSYHIYKGSPQEDFPSADDLIAQENTRYAFTIDSNGRSVLDLDIDLFGYREEECFVLFDIVDEQNSYWMAGNDPTILKYDCIAYSPSEESLLPPVVCRVLGNKITAISHTTALVEVTFNDMRFYNENCRLSYHIYHGESESTSADLFADENLILYENKRYEIYPDENGKCIVPVELSISATHGKDQLIRFDIIDPDNNRWLLMTSPLLLDTDVLGYQRNLISAIKESVSNAVALQKSQFIVNVGVTVAVIIIIVIIRKKRLLTFKRR